MAGDEVVVIIEREVLRVDVGQPGPPGANGRDGLGALSTDPNNRATLDAQGDLLVPDLLTDPLAYYILARS